MAYLVLLSDDMYEEWMGLPNKSLRVVKVLSFSVIYGMQ